MDKTEKVQVNFICQKCCQPLKLDHSFEDLKGGNKRVYDDLITPVIPGLSTLPDFAMENDKSLENTEVNSAISDEIYRYIHPARSLTTDSENEFTIVGESQRGFVQNIGCQLRVTSELFDILSGQSEVDHPLCEECTDNLLDLLEQQFRNTEEECKDYRQFLDTLQSDAKEESDSDLEDEMQKLQNEEGLLRQQLDSIENERNQIRELTKQEEEKVKKFELEENEYFKQYNEYKRQLLEYEDAQKSVDNQVKYAKLQLDRLTKTNVFNATFHIWHCGDFGTINNFRLGTLPNIPVDWNEINAAWGQTVLLLHSLASKIDLNFERYRLIPYGNHSYVETLGDKPKGYPLHNSGGIRFFWNTKFDQGMVAFLDCLQQFKEAVERGDQGFSLPYKMEKGKIEDPSTRSSYSIKTQFNSEEQWTKALKFMLTNLKWSLAWVASQFGNK